MAHPIRPASYVKMDNFYTSTVYEKGCQVCSLKMRACHVKSCVYGIPLFLMGTSGLVHTQGCRQFAANAVFIINACLLLAM